MGKQYQIRNGVVTEITPQVAAIVGRNVGELVHSIVPLVDANLHLLDGTVLPDDGVYADGIAKIKALQASYPNLFITEADWQASVTQYDACGKFVIGTGTLRLPKITKFLEGTTDAAALGDLVEAGAPDITGTGPVVCTPYTDNTGPTGAGAITVPTKSKNLSIASGSANWRGNFAFAASDSNATYGNADTIQPQSIKGFFYIVLGTFPKSSAVVNLDNMATDLNSKTTAEQAAHAAMPSHTILDMTSQIPAASGGTVTAPADGYMHFIAKSTTTSAYINATNTNSSGNIVMGQQETTVNNRSMYLYFPVSAGDVIRLGWGNSNPTSLHFIYCNGNAHLAS